jgi:GalNAc-alpha-(1->4)-GalNAc-alpha-(1->3)-diNAcBac-PP-undecaprenol alpha-1,4-N-acetyl-D-galactosaminyltransferase
LPDLKLVIAGEGRELKSLRRLADSLGAGSAVVFVGTVDNLTDLMRGAIAFVLSSRYEGFPNVLLEALACGVPTIATDCPDGPREILGDGRFGLLVPREDPQALALAMTRISVDADLRRRLGALGSQAVQPYERSRVLDAWEAVLRIANR